FLNKLQQILKCSTFMTLFCLVLASGSNSKQTTQQSEENAAHTEQTQSSKELNTDKDKKMIKKELLSWLDEHEKDNHKAVSNRYFGNGSMSDGDWYAGSEDGE